MTTTYSDGGKRVVNIYISGPMTGYPEYNFPHSSRPRTVCAPSDSTSSRHTSSARAARAWSGPTTYERT